MSAEKLVRRALWQAAVARIATEAVAGLGSVLISAGRALDNIADAGFTIEADAARRYRLLTGVDLGDVTGVHRRYDATRDDYERPQLMEIEFGEEDEDE